jgi:hypothetical protein
MQPAGQSKRPLTSHITQLWRAARCQDVPVVAQGIRLDGDTQGLDSIVARRGRLQIGLETNSALSAYATCNRVGSAEMPVILLQVGYGSSQALVESSKSPSPSNPSNHCAIFVVLRFTRDYRYPESKLCPFLPSLLSCFPFIDICLG